MRTPSATASTDTGIFVDTSFDPAGEPGGRRDALRRLEQLEDERRLRDELADWDDFSIDDIGVAIDEQRHSNRGDQL